MENYRKSLRLPDEDASSFKQGKLRSFIENFWEYATPLEKTAMWISAAALSLGIVYGSYRGITHFREKNTKQAVAHLYELPADIFEQKIVGPIRASFARNLEGDIIPDKKLPFETRPTIDEITRSLEHTNIYSLKRPVQNDRAKITEYSEINRPTKELTQILDEIEKRGYDLESSEEIKSWVPMYVKGTLLPTIRTFTKKSPEMYAQVPPDIKIIYAQLEQIENSLQIPKGKLATYFMLNDKLKFTAQRKFAIAKNDAQIQQNNNPSARRFEREFDYLRGKDQLSLATEVFKSQTKN